MGSKKNHKNLLFSSRLQLQLLLLEGRVLAGALEPTPAGTRTCSDALEVLEHILHFALRSAGRAGHPPARGIGKEEHGHAVRSGGRCCSVLGTTQCRARLPRCNSSHTAHIAENILLPTAASLQGPKKAA